MRFAVLAVGTLAILPCTSGRRLDATAAGSTSCSRRTPRWSPPTTLWSGFNRIGVVHPASVSAMGGSVLILGHQSAPPARPSPDTVFAGLWFRPGSSSPLTLHRPPGARFFLSPIAAVDTRGTPHVLWAEPGRALADTGDAIHGRPKSVWASTLGASGWTPPILVAESDGIAWNGVSASEVVTSGDGSLHLAVPSAQPGVAGALLHLRGTLAGWSVSTIRLPNASAYAALAEYRGGLLLAFVAPIPGPAPDLNSLWFSRSTDNGATWESPTVVSKSGGAAANDPKLIVTRGAVHLIWFQNPRTDSQPGALRHVESRDGGVTWSSPADLPAARLFALQGAVADAAGDVHVLFTRFTSTGKELAHARWCGSHWSAVDRVPLVGSPIRVGNAVVRLDHSGLVNVVASNNAFPPNASPTVTWEITMSR